MKKLLILHLVFLHVPIFSTRTPITPFIPTLLHHCNQQGLCEILIATHALHNPKILEEMYVAHNRYVKVKVLTPPYGILRPYNCAFPNEIIKKSSNLFEKFDAFFDNAQIYKVNEKFLKHTPSGSICCFIHENSKNSRLIKSTDNISFHDHGTTYTITKDYQKIERFNRRFHKLRTKIENEYHATYY